MNKLNISKKLGLTGIGLCVLCCTLPLLAMLSGIAALTAAAYYVEKIGILLIGGAALLFLYSRFKKAPSCSIDCDCKNETSKSNL